MARPDTFWAYIMGSESGVLYVAVTSDFARRVMQHKSKIIPGFTQRYNVRKLVWFEAHSSVRAAVSREKDIKGWGRMKRVKLIEEHNPTWKDLSLS
jgi:putative endonuclease